MRTEMRLSPLFFFFFLLFVCLFLLLLLLCFFFLCVCVFQHTHKVPNFQKKKGGEKMELIVTGYRVNTFFFLNPSSHN